MVYETWLESILVSMIASRENSANTGSLMILRIFRLSRLARIARVGRLARILRAFPELSILANAMVYALRSVGATLALLIITMYVFSIFFVQMIADTDFAQGRFENVLQGMNTLLVQGIMADQADMLNGMLAASFWYYFMIWLYMITAALTVANMLIGVICDIIGNMSEEKQEENIKEKLHACIAGVFSRINEDGNQTISKSEFGQMISDRVAARLLKDEGIDVFSLVSYADTIFEDDTMELEFQDFMEVILGFREEDASMKHQLEVKRYLKEKLDGVQIKKQSK